MSSSRVLRMKFLSPETMQRSKTWRMTGSRGRPGVTARMWASKDGRNDTEPGVGRLYIKSDVVTIDVKVDGNNRFKNPNALKA